MLCARSIVNVCGRFNLKEGIKERFSAKDLATLRDTGRMEVPHPRTGEPFVITQQVRPPLLSDIPCHV